MCVHPYIKEINGQLMPLPCGHCVECYRAYQRDWTFRIKQEIKDIGSHNCWYVTLTYNDEHLPVLEFDGVKQSCVFVSEVQNFLKRLRKLLHHPRCRYFAVGEYGGKYNRAHYHLLLFTDVWKNVHQCYIDCLSAWAGRGFVYCKKTEDRHIHYLTKYVNKLDARPHWKKPFKLMSKGLGASFLSSHMISFFAQYPIRQIRNFNGKLIPLPRYYVKKLNDYLDNFYHAGLKFSEVCPVTLPKSTEVRWYHDYFCRNYHDIRENFIDEELNNCFITKFLNPSENMVFDWFLKSNKFTNDSLKLDAEKLDKCFIKNGLYELGISPDFILDDSFDDFI